MSTNTVRADIQDKSYIVDMTIQSTGISSGALTVAGGVGIAKNVNIGGNLYLSNTFLDNVSGFNTDGSLGNMIYHNGTSYTQFSGGTNTQVLQINNSIPSWVAPSSVGITSHGSLSNLTVDDHTQYLLINGSRNMTGELDMNFGNFDNVGGFAGTTGFLGDIPIRNATEYIRLGGGTTNQILSINSSVPAWVSQSSIIHSSLASLSNDDHTQYILVNGSRAMTGEFDMGSNNFNNVGGFAGVAGALGDIPIRNATEYTRLPVGSSGQFLSITSSVPTWISQTSIAHSLLSGLTTGDDHTQYLLLNGSRAMTGELDMGGNNIVSLTGFAGIGSNIGDTIYHNGTEYIALSPGTNGQVLSISSSVPTWITLTASQTPWATDIDADNYRLSNINKIGTNSTAGSTTSLAVGIDANARGVGSIAIGKNSLASTLESIAIGNSCISTGTDSVSVGYLTKNYGLNTVAIGAVALASGEGAVSIGGGSGNGLVGESGIHSVALANNASARGAYSIATGPIENLGDGSVEISGFGSGTRCVSISGSRLGDDSVGLSNDSGSVLGLDGTFVSTGSIVIRSISNNGHGSLGIGDSAYTSGSTVSIGYRSNRNITSSTITRSVVIGSRAQAGTASDSIVIGSSITNTVDKSLLISPNPTTPILASNNKATIMPGCMEQLGRTTFTASTTISAGTVGPGNSLVFTGSTASQSLTLPTGTNIDTEFAGILTSSGFGESYTVYFRNEATVSVDIIQNTGSTFVFSGGSPTTFTTNTGGLFRFVRTAANTWSVYINKGLTL